MKARAYVGAVSAEADRLEHVLTGADAAVEMHLDVAADRIDDLRQGADRRTRAVELAPAVIGDDDRVGAGFRRHARILRDPGFP